MGVAKLTGQVVAITNSGDLVTDIMVSNLGSAPRGETLKITCEGHTTLGLFSVDHEQPEMTFLAFENASGAIQISIVGGAVSAFLGIGTGAKVEVSW